MLRICILLILFIHQENVHGEENAKKRTISDDVINVIQGKEKESNIFRGRTGNKGFTQYIRNLKKIIMNTKCSKDCSMFDEKFKPDAGIITDILTDLKPLNGTSLKENSADDVLYILSKLRNSMSKDFFDYVTNRLVLKRKDLKDVSLSTLQYDPEGVLPTESDDKDYTERSTEKDEMEFEILSVMRGKEKETNIFRGKKLSRERVEYVRELKKLLMKLECTKKCSMFDDEFEPQANMIIDILSELKPVGGVRVKENSINEVLLILSHLRNSMSKDFFFYIVNRIVLRRKDTKNVSLSPLQFDPEGFIPNGEDGEDYQDSGESESPVAGTDEEKLDYFREDSFLHSFHNDWHIKHEEMLPLNKKGERFWFMHQQFLARYMVERIFNGIDPIEPLGPNEMKHSFPSRYNNERFMSIGYRPTRDVCRISSSGVRDLERRKERAIRESSGRSLDSAITNVESVYHNMGHIRISDDCKSPGSHEGFMHHPKVSARDPIFYRWHLEVERVLREIPEFKRPYSENEVSPALGILVDDFFLENECGQRNTIQTFQDHTILSLPGSWNNNRRTIENFNHVSFTWKISVRNNERRRKKVILRIYGVPDERRYDRDLYLLLDQWTHTLSGQRDEIIERTNLDSAIISRNENRDCGLPEHLLVPRGSLGRSPPNVLRAVVFIHDVSSNVNEGEEGHRPTVLCGATRSSNTVFDSRIFGFPIAKRWPRGMLERAVDNGLENFGKISANIQIKHSHDKDCSERSSPPERPTTTTTARRPETTTIEATTTTTATTTTRSTTFESARTCNSGAGYYRIGENCYKVGGTPTHFFNAERYCEMDGGRLVTRVIRDEFREIEEKMYNRLRLRRRPFFWVKRRSHIEGFCNIANSRHRFRMHCDWSEHPAGVKMFPLCMSGGTS